MAFLENFSDEEKEFLVALPYRAGVWISRTDDAGGLAADAAELEALESIINKKAAGMFESAFVHEVMAEICAGQENWARWAKHASNLPDDCRKAISLMEGRLGRHDMDGYRENVMYIAVEVAKAFREIDLGAPPSSLSFVGRIKLFLDGIAGKPKGKKYEAERLLNISYNEDRALAALSESLGIKRAK
ncbi:MAG: hypothetical protein HY370_01125 [Proteobacteria bacterium]|nr:hypothetical protein [Pseudomonadota bacterium]